MEKIMGRNPVLEALKSGKRRVEKIIISKGTRGYVIDEIYELAKSLDIPVSFEERRMLDKICGDENHQGVAGFAEDMRFCGIDEILNSVTGHPPLLLVLDSIEDTGNLGAIIRSAESFGVDGIIIPKDRSAGITPSVTKTSAGAVEHVNICRVVNLSSAIEELKNRNVWIVGADEEAEKEISEIDFNMPVAVVIGGEDRGIRRLLREKCDFLCRIPQSGRINSLNASVATGIMLYEATRQRRGL